VVALIRPEFERRGVGLSVREPRDPLTVLGDQDGLEQVVLNLLDNALDASGSEKEVVLALERAGAKAVMRVKDSGAGIPPENLDSIFDPFFTTKEMGRGSGLGLTIVHDLVSGHGGTIEVRSTVNVGTEFLVELPLKGLRDQP
jgi:signal transduction histidine kinase